MLVTIHLCSASQQHLVVALTTLPTIESHRVPYKCTRKTFLQFPCTLAGESPKWNILVVTWVLVICLKYTHLHSGALALGHTCTRAAPSCSCVYFRQITRAHVTTTTYIYYSIMHDLRQLCQNIIDYNSTMQPNEPIMLQCSKFNPCIVLIIVTGFAKRGETHTSISTNLENHNILVTKKQLT